MNTVSFGGIEAEVSTHELLGRASDRLETVS